MKKQIGTGSNWIHDGFVEKWWMSEKKMMVFVSQFIIVFIKPIVTYCIYYHPSWKEIS